VGVIPMKKKKLNLSNYVKNFISCALIAAGFMLLFVSRLSREFSHWYSTHLYQVWVNVTGRFMGIFPFSVSEVLLYILLAVILGSGIWLALRLLRKNAGKNEAVSWLVNLFLLAAVLFFSYVLNCGINYNRDSFSQSSGIKAGDYAPADLKVVCSQLTQELNRLSDEVMRDSEGVMQLKNSACEGAVNAMTMLGEDYPGLVGYYPRPKGLLFPSLLSIQHLSGIYSPFTIEADYNSGMADYNIPFAACHELSHLRGFMQEEEANFIAFLACIESGDAEFQYSGYLSGWTYCMNVLYAVDYDAWEEVRDGLSDAVEADIEANTDYWVGYDGTVAEVANQINDTYLKANGQEDGVESYDQMVVLIVGYYSE